MYTLLLAVIYLAFISLGLPDSLLGAAWPVMHVDLGASVSYAGAVTIIISIGTVLSSLLSDRLTNRFGAGKVTFISVLMTAVALLGFSASDSFWQICLWAVPYGLGAGAVDAALNNYVALHYTSRHMSWLHCFWGVGAAIGPYIMGYCLTGVDWRGGYRIISCLQFALSAIILLSLPLWKKRPGEIVEDKSETETRTLGLIETLKLRGMPLVLIAFFAYCAVEQTSILWASSYLTQYRGVSEDAAARFASLFFLGITAGRFLNGFVADKLGDKKMIRIGIIIMAVGAVAVGLPIESNILALIGLVVVGLGCAPVYPCIIHATPDNFGRENSQAAIGVEMASAYIGTTVTPPLFGLIAEHISIGLYPLYIFLFAAAALALTEISSAIINVGVRIVIRD